MTLLMTLLISLFKALITLIVIGFAVGLFILVYMIAEFYLNPENRDDSYKNNHIEKSEDKI